MSERNLKVTKSNHLIEASYRLTLNEQRLVLSAISQIDGRCPMPKDNRFTVRAKDFAGQFGGSIKDAYEALKEASDRLYERDIRTFDRAEQSRERFRWVSSVKYWDGQGAVTIAFSPEIRPYLSLLHQQFTSYELRQVSQLPSAYAIRIYELLVQFSKTGERFITVEAFRQMLELQDEYQRFFDLRRWVIEPAVKAINATTNIRVTWEPVKKGAKITSLAFSFDIEPQEKLAL